MRCCDERTILVEKDGAKTYMSVGCGKCYACRFNLTQDWIARLDMECRCWSTTPLFLTLTYSDYYINHGHYSTDVPSVWKDHLQKFFKRVRKALSPGFIRYFALGEYGGRTARPHYHVILFHGFSDDDIHILRDLIEREWYYGHSRVSAVNPRRLAYCASYHINKGFNPEGSELGFTLPSKRPGIGGLYVDSGKLDYTLDPHYGNDSYCSSNGQMYTIPRYVKKRLSPDAWSWPWVYPEKSYSDFLKEKYLTMDATSRQVVEFHANYVSFLNSRHLESIRKHGKYLSNG